MQSFIFIEANRSLTKGLRMLLVMLNFKLSEIKMRYPTGVKTAFKNFKTQHYQALDQI